MNPFRWAAFLAAFGAQCTAIQLTQFPIFFIVRPFSLPAFRRYVRWTQRQWASTIVAITATFRYACTVRKRAWDAWARRESCLESEHGPAPRPEGAPTGTFAAGIRQDLKARPERVRLACAQT